MQIIQFHVVPQPGNNGYYWSYGLGDDNKMYCWHELKGDWVLLKNKKKQDEKK